VASGGEYPDPHGPDDAEKVDSWASGVRASLDGAILLSLTCGADGDADFDFDRGLRLHGGSIQRYFSPWHSGSSISFIEFAASARCNDFPTNASAASL